MHPSTTSHFGLAVKLLEAAFRTWRIWEYTVVCKRDTSHMIVLFFCPFAFNWFTFSQLNFPMLAKNYPYFTSLSSELSIWRSLFSSFHFGCNNLYLFLFIKLLVKVSYVDLLHVVYIMSWLWSPFGDFIRYWSWERYLLI